MTSTASASTSSSIPEESHTSSGSTKKSTAEKLVELALDVYDIHVDTDGKPFGIRQGGGHVARYLTSGCPSLQAELGALYYRETRHVPSQNAKTEATAVLEYEAADQDPVPVSTRVATADGMLYVDLGDADEHVVRIGPDGWDVITDDVPVVFTRTRLTKALPMPSETGDLQRLWKFVNVPDEETRHLFTGWLVSAIVLIGLPCPILALLGEQGTAKTSGMRTLLSLVDPSTSPVRRPPKDADSLMHGTHSCRAVGFDNLSSIPPWMSDALCRIVTGESDADRSLYTDDDLRIISSQAAVAFTGIDVGALRGDLAERCLWGDLQVIPASRRLSERELNQAWETAYPIILGGLYDLIAQVLAARPDVHLTEKPRMADFAEILAAMDAATGSRALARYLEDQENVAADIVDTAPVPVAIAKVVTGQWEGTAKQLYGQLEKPADDRFWPTARGMDGQLKRFAPDLRKAGWTVVQRQAPAGSNRAKTWLLIAPDTGAKVIRLAGRTLTADEVDAITDARSMVRDDVEEWMTRLESDGVPVGEIGEAVDAVRTRQGITAPGRSYWRDSYRRPAARSALLDEHLATVLNHVGLTLPEADSLIDQHHTTEEAA